MMTFSRLVWFSLCVVLLGTGCHRKQQERERQTAQLQTISKRLDEIQANLAVMSEARPAAYASAPVPAAIPSGTPAPVTLNPDDGAVVQITDFSKAEPLSRKEKIARLGQRAPTARHARGKARHGHARASGKKSSYNKTIAVSGLSAVDVQKALKNAGFNPGKVDGKLGPNTVKAIKQFQAAEGLKADGVVGRRTWEKLNAHLAGPATAPAAASGEKAAPVADVNSFNVF